MIIEVEDNGRGIEQRDQERIFELFRRAGPQDRPGEGMGLAHVRALVRRLGGVINLKSTPGKGSDLHGHPAASVFSRHPRGCPHEPTQSPS